MNIFVSGALAFCSLGYNFVFSNLLAVTLGATVIQYCISLGLYISSLGLGSIVFDYFNHRAEENLKKKPYIFFWIEGLICFTAFIGSFYIVWNNNLANDLGLMPLKLFSYLPTIVLGFLSGMELPFLIDYGKESESKWILVSDFIGMALMCVAFGFLVVPWFGFIQALMIFISLNFLTMNLFWIAKYKASVKLSTLSFAIILCLLLLPDWESVIRDLYMRGA